MHVKKSMQYFQVVFTKSNIVFSWRGGSYLTNQYTITV